MPLIVHTQPAFSLAFCFLPTVDRNGAGGTIFRPVGVRNEGGAAFFAPLCLRFGDQAVFQHFVLRQHRPAKPSATERRGNHLGTNIVKQNAVLIVIVAAGFPNQGICAPPLPRLHAWKRSVRFTLDFGYGYAHMFCLAQFVCCRSQSIRSCFITIFRPPM